MTPPQIHRNAPSWNGLRTAAIGTGQFADQSTGAAFLRETCKDLRREGFEAVIGPMDGTTWRKYRLPIWSDGSPGFVMEPDAGPHDLLAYKEVGFDTVELHVSSTAVPGSRGWSNVVSDVSIESWDGHDAQTLLTAAHALVMTGFRKTPFFTPIPVDVFIAAYEPLLKRADPNFILQAVDERGQPVGLTLAFPDPLRNGAIILKTYVATVPGVGRAMADRVHELAARRGYAEVIHALMRSGIASEAQSRKFSGKVFRRYALMGRML